MSHPTPQTPSTSSGEPLTTSSSSSTIVPESRQTAPSYSTANPADVPATSTKPAGKGEEGKPNGAVNGTSNANQAAVKKVSGKDAKKEKRAAAVAQRQAAEKAAAGSSDATSGGAGAGADGKNTSAGGGHGHGGSGGPAAKTTSGKPSKESSASKHLSSTTTLFSHLPRSHIPNTATRISSGKYHPIIVRYGLLISTGQIRGTNARVIGLLCAFKEVIRSFSMSSANHQDWSRLLLAHLSPMISFLEECRPKGVGGGNAIRFMKGEINKIGTNPDIKEEAEQKQQILTQIDNFLRERIELADEVIAETALEKIHAGSTIVTYARSSLVEKVILRSWESLQAQTDPEERGSFSVIVVDSSPLYEGKLTLKALTAAGIPTSYCLLATLPALLPRASIVLLGTAALLSDGSLYSRAGTAMVAMLARESRIPVVACCETYKFGEKVVLDAVTGNELGDPTMLLNPGLVAGGASIDRTLPFVPNQKKPTRIPNSTEDQHQQQPQSRQQQNQQQQKQQLNKPQQPTTPSCLTPIHLLYDLTPASLITAVCSEVGFIPASAVPTVMVKADAEIAF